MISLRICYDTSKSLAHATETTGKTTKLGELALSRWSRYPSTFDDTFGDRNILFPSIRKYSDQALNSALGSWDRRGHFVARGDYPGHQDLFGAGREVEEESSLNNIPQTPLADATRRLKCFYSFLLSSSTTSASCAPSPPAGGSCFGCSAPPACAFCIASPIFCISVISSSVALFSRAPESV